MGIFGNNNKYEELEKRIQIMESDFQVLNGAIQDLSQRLTTTKFSQIEDLENEINALKSWNLTLGDAFAEFMNKKKANEELENCYREDVEELA